jgi:hypothetical protein
MCSDTANLHIAKLSKPKGATGTAFVINASAADRIIRGSTRGILGLYMEN